MAWTPLPPLNAMRLRIAVYDDDGGYRYMFDGLLENGAPTAS